MSLIIDTVCTFSGLQCIDVNQLQLIELTQFFSVLKYF